MGGGAGLRDDDAAAIVRLVGPDIDPAFQQELVDSLQDPERTRRGNALRVLASVLDVAELASIARAALSDDDPVVRRMDPAPRLIARSPSWQLNWPSVVPQIVTSSRCKPCSTRRSAWPMTIRPSPSLT